MSNGETPKACVEFPPDTRPNVRIQINSAAPGRLAAVDAALRLYPGCEVTLLPDVSHCGNGGIASFICDSADPLASSGMNEVYRILERAERDRELWDRRFGRSAVKEQT